MVCWLPQPCSSPSQAAGAIVTCPSLLRPARSPRGSAVTLFLSGHFTTWLPVVLGRFAERKSPGQAALAQAALPVLGRAGLPESLNSGYLLEVIRAVNLAFSAGYLPCLRQSSAGTGTGLLWGAWRCCSPRWMPAQAPGERTPSPLLAQELGGGLGSPLLLSSVSPTRNDPAPGVRGCAALLEQDTDISLSIPPTLLVPRRSSNSQCLLT